MTILIVVLSLLHLEGVFAQGKYLPLGYSMYLCVVQKLFGPFLRAALNVGYLKAEGSRAAFRILSQVAPCS